MLRVLFDNPNIEKIFLFLFVNQTGYGTQIQRLLNTPLTPLQKAFNKLEDHQVVESYFEKNKKIYQFNPKHPLFNELEALLKKAYLHLSSEEKAKYCFVHKPKLKIEQETKRDLFRNQELKSFFRRLSKVKDLQLEIRSKKENQVELKEGKASVLISSNDPSELIFHEKGSWHHNTMSSIAFTNSFRWTLDLKASLITLEHLRYGYKEPVFLFHLTTNQTKSLESVQPHVCSQDIYLANISWNNDHIHFNLRIIGPNKNEYTTYIYN